MLFPYQDKDTPLHRLDARPKMVFVLAFFLLSILISDILYLSAMLVLALTVVARGRVARETLGLLKYTIYVVAFLFLFSIIFPLGRSAARSGHRQDRRGSGPSPSACP